MSAARLPTIPADQSALIRSEPAPVDPLLIRIRVSALACRTAARTDLFEACAVLSADRETADAAHIEVLTRCLAQGLGRAPQFFRPGALEVSFDEAWLMRLLNASSTKDSDSFAFLLRSRVHRSAQRNLAFLLHRIAARLG